ncbi:MAG: hypothetical protein O3A25_19450 [Acidobacteria bacterium]|nr:hypothetical protein [Acidobacteriota bacterium]
MIDRPTTPSPPTASMLMKMAVLHRIKTGEISVVFRRWRRPTVKAGGTLKTAVGLLNIQDVEDVTEPEITEPDVIRAGYDNKAGLLHDLGTRGGRLSRVSVAYAGADPRLAPRETHALSAAELDGLVIRLRRLDTRSITGPWTARVLDVIERYPDVAARVLAEHLGCERDWLKPTVRKLKNLGLTISHDPGYILSPRGQTVLRHLRAVDVGHHFAEGTDA